MIPKHSSTRLATLGRFRKLESRFAKIPGRFPANHSERTTNAQRSATRTVLKKASDPEAASRVHDAVNANQKLAGNASCARSSIRANAKGPAGRRLSFRPRHPRARAQSQENRANVAGWGLSECDAQLFGAYFCADSRQKQVLALAQSARALRPHQARAANLPPHTWFLYVPRRKGDSKRRVTRNRTRCSTTGNLRRPKMATRPGAERGSFLHFPSG